MGERERERQRNSEAKNVISYAQSNLSLFGISFVYFSSSLLGFASSVQLADLLLDRKQSCLCLCTAKQQKHEKQN